MVEKTRGVVSLLARGFRHACVRKGREEEAHMSQEFGFARLSSGGCKIRRVVSLKHSNKGFETPRFNQ